MAKRTCRVCEELKDEEEFYLNRSKGKNDQVYESRRTECRTCTDERTREYHRENRDRVILNNCRRGGKRRGLKCDLTRELVKGLISKPCHYCEEDRPGEIGLDRVDNSKGYITTNVVPCCILCNGLKRDMPTEAWEFLAPHVKEARELGLFGDWIPHNRGSNAVGRSKKRRPESPDRRLRANRS